MRFGIVGAGGIGGYAGARLGFAGEDVAFVARGAHLAAMQRDGLVVKAPDGDVRLTNVRASASPVEIGPVDVLLVGVKLWDLESATRAALPMVGPATAIIGFQNGVEKDTTLGSIVGAEHVIGGVCYISTEIERPGVILKKGSLERFVIGEFDGRPSERLLALEAAFRRAGIGTELTDDVSRATWEKFVFLACNAAMTTLLRLPLGPIRENPRSRALLFDAVREAVAVAQAKGIALADGFAESTLTFIDTLPPQTRASMSVDLERGNRLEVEWLSGAIARIGRELGVPTPVHRVVADALAPFARGRPAAQPTPA